MGFGGAVEDWICAMKAWWLACLSVLLSGVAAEAADLQGHLEQGGLALGRVAPGTDVRLEGRSVAVDDAGRFLLGFSRDAPGQMRLEIAGKTETLDIAPRNWPVQRIDGLPQAKVTPDPAQTARILAENRLIAERRSRSAASAFFLAGVIWPVDGPVSGVFGSQRVLNGEARAPHSGLDIAAPEGAAVKAVAAGRISMAHPDMFLTGRTVMIDHGLGLQTVYAHLSRMDVGEGQWVEAGQVIGAVGASGRATGPHLHWGVSWQDVKLDPQTIFTVLDVRTGG